MFPSASRSGLRAALRRVAPAGRYEITLPRIGNRAASSVTTESQQRVSPSLKMTQLQRHELTSQFSFCLRILNMATPKFTKSCNRCVHRQWWTSDTRWCLTILKTCRRNDDKSTSSTSFRPKTLHLKLCLMH